MRARASYARSWPGIRIIPITMSMGVLPRSRSWPGSQRCWATASLPPKCHVGAWPAAWRGKEHLALQRVVHRAAGAVVKVVLVERMYCLSLGQPAKQYAPVLRATEPLSFWTVESMPVSYTVRSVRRGIGWANGLGTCRGLQGGTVRKNLGYLWHDINQHIEM